MLFIQPFKTSPLRLTQVFVLICLLWLANDKSFAAEQNTSVVKLLAKYTELAKQLNNNQFHRPLYLNSEESQHDLKGEIYAVVDYPFTTFNSALSNPAHWCDALILNINIKYCHTARNQEGDTLTLNIGKKYYQQIEQSYRVEFKYREIISTPNYFSAELDSKSGPLDTYDYRILIEATPLKDGHTFLHFTYAYSFGFTGRIAMQTYLATLGRNKVGFTIDENTANGKPQYIQGVRGVVERNTMRYYLAIDAYLAALKAPFQDQLERGLQQWYSATEQYARQLHEVERVDYLEMKHLEYQRQQTAQ
jgi:hypothetical protein